MECEQSKEGVFLDKCYQKGQVFKRKDCLDYDLGYSCYTGKYCENCDGVVMKFFDGKEVLSDFCEFVGYDCPDVLWAVTKDIERIEIAAKKDIQEITEQYNRIIRE